MGTHISGWPCCLSDRPAFISRVGAKRYICGKLLPYIAWAQWVPRSKSPANYCPTSPGPVPPSPSYVPRSPEWAPTSPLPAKLCPTSPGLVPPSPPYVPRSPDYAPTSPPLGPFSPSSPYTTDPYDELERELDGWWGRGRFVYNRARSVVPEEEEQGQRCERETSTEPSPDLPDWAEEADVEREAEQDIRAQQPVTVVPEEEELPDYEYYEQLDREEKEDQERDAEQHVQVQEPAAAVVPEEDDGNQPFNLFAFTSGHPDPSTFPWIRSNPFLPTPSASTREFTSESEDLPDYEYYEALEQETAAEMVAEKGVQVQQPAAAVPEEDLPDYEYYEELEQETPAEALVQLETQHSVVDPYPDIAKLNCVPRNEPHSNTYSSPSPKIFTHCDAEAEQKDWRSYSPFRTASKLDSSFPRASQKPIGRVKVEKRIDRMMWNKLMQKKMAVMIEVCEKYAPADVLKGLKLDR
ncbi:hypothetical protein N0V85_006704 [Neurospora sp. IMI 360204]|nr:hypothetical protein N0V85_006704 [Neurospora sp. IMI 360204]